jgi:hypothetical protein
MYCCSLLQIAPTLFPCAFYTGLSLRDVPCPSANCPLRSLVGSSLPILAAWSSRVQGAAPCRGLLALEGEDVTVQLPKVFPQRGSRHVDMHLVGRRVRNI